MKTTLFFLSLTTALHPSIAVADQDTGRPEVGPAFETNLLWPFFPGGLSDFRVVLPITDSLWRGEAVAGVYSDFAWRFVRDDGTYGRVAAMGVKLGYRQFLGSGFHVEPTVQLNWRHERDRPDFEGDLNGFQGRLWTFAGYQHELSPRVYINARGGLGVHLFRTDELGDEERKLVPAGDLNIGIRWR